MAEQTDLEKITDVVTIVTATVGAILGTLGFWRSLRTERKLTYRPAFKAYFEELNNTLCKHLQLAEFLIHNLNEAITENDLPDELPDNLQFDESDYDLEHPVWHYDRGFRLHLKRTITLSSRLRDAVASYNELRYPSSSAYVTWRGLMNAKYGADIVELGNGSTNLEPRDEKNRREVLKTVEPFIGDCSDSIGDLMRNRKYRRHLRRRLRTAKRAMQRFDDSQSSLERKRKLIESQLADIQPMPSE